MIRTFLDAGVLIAAYRSIDDIGRASLAILDQDNRVFLSSQFVQLEVLPKAIHGRRDPEAAVYRTFFASAALWNDHPAGISDALSIASQHGLNGMDALHLAAARAMHADEFVTAERPTSPIFRFTDIRIVSIRPISPAQLASRP